jgi:DNA topoisomerase I
MADLYEALQHADEAELYYVTDARPGISRRRRGKGFSYTHPDGTKVGDETRTWIETQLVIPPAWTDVWICPNPDGHLLATGRDAKGRKVYLYHPRWREVRDSNKYHRLRDFGRKVPDIRERVEADLSGRGLSRRRVLAAVVDLLDQTLIRIGNEAYAEENSSYGLTTLQDDHACVTGGTIQLEFAAKHGVEQRIAVRDPRLARIVKQCQDLPGEELFQYLDDGEVVDVTSTDVNAYLREATGGPFTAKDFRTWGGTVVAAESLAGAGPASTKREADKKVLAAVDTAAEALGNTRTVCRNCYVHPGVEEAYRDGSLLEAWKGSRASTRFSRGESCVLKVLEARSERDDAG